MDSGLLVKVLPKGQITIPVKFRRQLGVEENDYLKVEFKQGKLVVKRVEEDWQEKYVRKYNDEEIEEFLAADRLSDEERQAAERWLKSVK